MVLNPNGAHYDGLKAALKKDYEDLLWSEDVVVMERNSRTFKERSNIINQNAEALCDFLVAHEKGNYFGKENLKIYNLYTDKTI